MLYENIDKAIDHQRAQQTIVMGDFNAKVGEGDETCLGHFPHGERNDRGQDLINYCLLQDLKNGNSFFKKKPGRKWTWRSPDYETKNEIDYFLTNKISTVKNVEVINKVKGSDH